MDQSFPKSERLNSRKTIEGLFSAGNSFLVFPYKVLWSYRESEIDIPVKAAFAVSKRKFRKAVDRNLLKRRSREAYRKNNVALKTALKNENKCIDLMLVYVADNKLEYAEIQLKIILILQRLAKMNG